MRAKIKREQMSLESIKEVVNKIFNSNNEGIEFLKKGHCKPYFHYILDMGEDYFICRCYSKHNKIMVIVFDSLIYAKAFEADHPTIKIYREDYISTKESKTGQLTRQITLERAKWVVYNETQSLVEKDKEGKRKKAVIARHQKKLSVKPAKDSKYSQNIVNEEIEKNNLMETNKEANRISNMTEQEWIELAYQSEGNTKIANLILEFLNIQLKSFSWVPPLYNDNYDEDDLDEQVSGYLKGKFLSLHYPKKEVSINTEMNGPPLFFYYIYNGSVESPINKNRIEFSSYK